VFKQKSKIDGKFYALKEIKVLHEKEGVILAFLFAEVSNHCASGNQVLEVFEASQHPEYQRYHDETES
jgi:hypothetical protein